MGLDVDVWDIDRDARLWPGGTPAIAHPPCRTWGRLRHFATKAPPDEHALALLALALVRQYGGIVEHPQGSQLWPEAGLPQPGKQRDEYGGWTLGIDQWWWGHRAQKRTLLYFVGIPPKAVQVPLRLGEPTHVVQSRKRTGSLPHIAKAEREQTPLALAIWLVALARIIEERR